MRKKFSILLFFVSVGACGFRVSSEESTRVEASESDRGDDSSLDETVEEEIKRIRKRIPGRKVSLLFDERQIESHMNNLARQLNARFAGKDVMVVGLLQGGAVIFGHLLTKLKFDLQTDFMTTKRCSRSQLNRLKVKWLQWPTLDYNGKIVLVVDNMLSYGITHKEVKSFFLENGAKEVFIAVLYDNCDCRRTEGLQKADFVGHVLRGVPTIVGFGFYYEQYGRNASRIYKID